MIIFDKCMLLKASENIYQVTLIQLKKRFTKKKPSSIQFQNKRMILFMKYSFHACGVMVRAQWEDRKEPKTNLAHTISKISSWLLDQPLFSYQRERLSHSGEEAGGSSIQVCNYGVRRAVSSASRFRPSFASQSEMPPPPHKKRMFLKQKNAGNIGNVSKS